MKKYIFGSLMALFAAFGFTACSEEAGTEPGTDSQPLVSIYQYDVELPYNADNDTRLRLVANNKVEKVFYLVEDTANYNARIAELGESGYNKYVTENGTEVELAYESYDEETEDEEGNTTTETIELKDGNKVAELLITDLLGENVITVVAASGNTLKSSKVTFNGIVWETVTEGTYIFSNNFIIAAFGASTNATTLQVDAADPTSYRFKDVYGPGYSLKIKLLPELTATDDDGEYTFFRIPAQTTGLTYGSYGTINVRDIGYWQGNDAFVTSAGYESGMYEDGYCFVFAQYYVTAGNMGYDYDGFLPAEGGEAKAAKFVKALKNATPTLKLW